MTVPPPPPPPPLPPVPSSTVTVSSVVTPPPLEEPQPGPRLRWLLLAPLLLVAAAAVGVGAVLFLRSGSEPALPDAADEVSATVGGVGSGTATVSWTAAADPNGPEVTGFEVVAEPAASPTCTTTGATTCSITGLQLDTTYRFRVVTVAGESRSAESAPSAPVFVAGSPGFTDVPDDAFFAEGVAWMRTRGITGGYGGNPDLFNPEGSMSRGEMALFLYRTMGSPPVASAHGFTDVATSGELNDAVAWAKEQGITTGFGGNPDVYNPSGSVNRAQVAASMYRMAGEPPGSGPHGFVDVDADAYFEEPVRWLRETGITSGFGGDTSRFHPDGAMTRSQMATFLYRLVATPSAWADSVTPPPL